MEQSVHTIYYYVYLLYLNNFPRIYYVIGIGNISDFYKIILQKY